MSPTQRTLKWLRDAGYHAAIVEKWNPHCKRRQDLYGCIDIVAMLKGTNGLLGLQACSGAGGAHAARRSKILSESRMKLWLECGNRLWVISFSKRGPRGKAKVWTPRITDITIGEFE